ncbi:mannosyl-3-phosphoglycerate phosphatase [Rhodobium orientis]|uniref:Mannosyl-3-phosphoglycerate phosphatase n=1 Tax=Rhodobium orientis TaxID=34017 RepID=A0A327JSP3_9HYPH|nr:HAD-IIB family hydrolase [Rhodobium orientis]MBB4305255.1 mannosyl-3-phosphoglycerate phosphatase [Rhodobium orientis]MBK5952117.1 mannosyl-3-phosphoglycerate phosphatase [Rhodobium orientis]RAI26328.1 mannosyl-3-phosphoglycerate phosphatase [Rhodobium orientis]
MTLIVVTDLDGTLLDHDSYRWDAAQPALDVLKDRGIPLILSSSKTAAEIAPLRDALGFSHCPAIVENGAGILEGGDAAGEDGGETPYRRLRAVLDDLPAALREPFAGFGDWTAAEVAKRTGMGTESAVRAQARRFSEPGLWSGDEAGLEAFLAALAKHGVSARRGGRFLTLSFGADKADRMAEIAPRYANGDTGPTVIALGDAPNDICMLEAADIGIVIANPAHDPLPPLDGEAAGRILRSRLAGPSGWNESLLSVINGTNFGV